MDDATYLEFKDIKERLDNLGRKIDVIKGFFENFPRYRGFCDSCGALKEAAGYIKQRWLCDACLAREITK